MAHNLLFFDIETVPDDKLDISLNIPAKLGNVKDEKKVLAKQKEWIDGGQVKAHSVSPFHNKIVALEMYYQDEVGSNFYIMDYDDNNEEALLDRFYNIVERFDYIIGFNILNFDLPTIMFRSAMLGVKSSPLNLRRYSTKPIVDLMEVLAEWDKSKYKSLEWFGKRFGLKSCKSGDGSDIYEWHKKGEMDKIREHCRGDVEMTKELFYLMAEVYLTNILLY